MNITKYKRQWFETRRAELHAKGLRDAAIARQMGVKPPYLSEIVNGGNVGDAIIDRMCTAFGFSFPEQAVVNPSPNEVTIDPALLSELVEQVKLQTKLLNAVLDRKGT